MEMLAQSQELKLGAALVMSALAYDAGFGLIWMRVESRKLRTEIKKIKSIVARQDCYLAWLRRKDFLPPFSQAGMASRDCPDACEKREECPAGKR